MSPLIDSADRHGRCNSSSESPQRKDAPKDEVQDLARTLSIISGCSS